MHAAHESKEPTEALNFTVYNPKAWEAVQVSHWQPHTIQCVAYLYSPPETETPVAAPAQAST